MSSCLLYKPFNKIISRSDLDECFLDESMRVIILVVCHSPQHFLVQLEHRVVEELWMTEDATTNARQLHVTFGNDDLNFQLGEILVGSIKEKSLSVKPREKAFGNIRYP